ncbi:MAG: LD-carboxypeptidase [Bacteroidota bacterium]|nr:LD-carboxypeptidase [Bacteroidota bacterium]
MENERRRFLKLAGLSAVAIPLTGLSGNNTGTPAIPETVKPAALKPGDTIAISSPAGAVWDDVQTEKFISIISELGFKVKRGETLISRYGYFAGDDVFRAKELNELFADKEIKGIFCMKGGWGCARILDKLDYDLIRKNPKVILGFSDITSLLIALNAKAGLITFHGPVGNSGWNDFTVGYFKKLLIEKEKVLYSSTGKVEDNPVTICGGKAKGILIGGNLSVVASMMGSEFLPSWKDKILFLEEVKEEPYRIDRMLTQLKLAGVMEMISGIVIGKCVKCLAEEPQKAFTYEQVLEQHLKPLGIPAFYGAMIGHIENKFTLPLGALAEIDADAGTVMLLESAVE